MKCSEGLRYSMIGSLALIAGLSIGCEEGGMVPDVSLEGGLTGNSGMGSTSTGSSSGSGTTGSTGSTSTSGFSTGTSAGSTSGEATTGSSTGTTGGRGLPPGEAYGEWTYVEVEGALCRDGSPAGYYYREGSSPNLHVYLNGGGACADWFFCALNPANVNEDLPGERLIESTHNLLLLNPNPIRQVPPDAGIFKNDPRNPMKDWSAIWVPYCTGDVYAGTRRDVTVPDVEGETHQFVGYENIGLFLESFGAQFSDSEQVVLSGSSAGAFGTLINYDRVQEFFNAWDIPVKALVDSGIPMRDSVGPESIDYMAPCLQRRWRDLWGFDWLPEDCDGCNRADGGGLVQGIGDYLFKTKYPNRMPGGLLSSVNDNVMRGFFAAGGDPHDPNSTCENNEPIINVVGEAILPTTYTGPAYHEGMIDAIDNVTGRDRVGYYIMPGDKHMHLFRDRFYEDQGLGMSIAEWVGRILDGEPSHVGQLDM